MAPSDIEKLIEAYMEDCREKAAELRGAALAFSWLLEQLRNGIPGDAGDTPKLDNEDD